MGTEIFARFGDREFEGDLRIDIIWRIRDRVFKGDWGSLAAVVRKPMQW